MLISIIIPTLNRSASLKRTIDSIANQKYQAEYELIVIDNGSTDDTKLIQDFLKQNFKRQQYHYHAVPGLLACRHLGANEATGDILVFLDDDVELNKSYLKGVDNLFLNRNVHLATGPCLPKYETKAPDWLDYLWTATAHGKHCGALSLMDFGNSKIEIDPNFVWGLNFCIRKSTLFEVEGFNPDTMPERLQRFQGDGETGLTIKAKKKGIKAYYIPELSLYHHIPKSRLTTEYMIKRSFFQGVCNSFTQIREDYFEPKATGVEVSSEPSTIRKWRNKVHFLYRWIKPLFKKNEPKKIKHLRLSIAHAEKEGFNFHQKWFNSDEQVKHWVLKKNYMDTQQLPDE